MSETNMEDDVERDSDDECTTGNYLPYTFNNLTEAFTQCGIPDTHETEEERQKFLQELRNVLKEVSDLEFNNSDDFLLCFLRSRRFHVGRAATTIKHYYHFMGLHKQLYDKEDPKLVERVLTANIMGFLPYRDARGRAICFTRAGAWNTDELPTEDVIYGGFVSIKGPLMSNYLNQAAGVVSIVDLKGFSVKHVYNIIRYVLFFVRAITKCSPCRVKKIHVVNIPFLFSVMWNLLSPLLSERLQKRIIFHESENIETLHDFLPPDILPEELGGYLGSFSNKDWAPDLEWLLQAHAEDMRYGYTSARVDTDSDVINIESQLQNIRLP